jgi:translation initiation factor 2 subunit 2
MRPWRQLNSPNTTLTKDNMTRLVFIDCAACGSKRSVTQIKSGFHATTKADRKAQKKL